MSHPRGLPRLLEAATRALYAPPAVTLAQCLPLDTPLPYDPHLPTGLRHPLVLPSPRLPVTQAQAASLDSPQGMRMR